MDYFNYFKIIYFADWLNKREFSYLVSSYICEIVMIAIPERGISGTTLHPITDHITLDFSGKL